MSRLIYGPPEWIVNHFPQKQRRAFGFWTFVAAALLTPFFGREVLYVTVLSVVALIPNFSSETPTETE